MDKDERFALGSKRRLAWLTANVPTGGAANRDALNLSKRLAL